MTKDYEIGRETVRRGNRGDFERAHVRSVSTVEDVRDLHVHKVSWGAILAGVVLAMFSNLILNMLGVGVGAAAFAPAGVETGAAGYTLGTAIWWAVTALVSAFIGGFVAGRLCGHSWKAIVGWHGVTSWAVAVLLMGVVMTTAAGIMASGPLSDMITAGAAQEPAVAETTTTTELPQVSEDVANMLSGGAFFGALILLLGALTAWWGSRMGAAKSIDTYDERDVRIDTPLH